MSSFAYKTNGSLPPDGKHKIYFCCHPKDFGLYFEAITNEILLNHNNCAMWYLSDPDEQRDDEFFLYIKDMKILVVPITQKLLTEKNKALEFDLHFAIENHIPVLPLMQERGLEKLFNEKCGNLQFLDKNNIDPTAIDYKEKLETFLSSILVDDILLEKIRYEFQANVFVSYRKKDRKYAQELMHLIHSCKECSDIAFWYDEYLTIGEDFNNSIANALQKSDLFALIITPNVVMDVVSQNGNSNKNYVEKHEYPMAQNAGKIILPIEFVDTNREILFNKFGITNVISSDNKKMIEQSVKHGLSQLHIKGRDQTSEHEFLIGLAYLNGISVEVNGEKAIELIVSAANKGWLDAVEKLITIYSIGLRTARNEQKAKYWLKEKIRMLESQPYNSCSATAKLNLAKAYFSLGEKYTESTIKEEKEKTIKLYQKAHSILREIVSYNTDKVLKRESFVMLNRINRMTAIWYESQDNYEKALLMYKSVLDSYEKFADENNNDLLTLQNLILIYEDLGVCYIKLKKNDLAKCMLTKALKVCKPLINTTDIFKYLYVSICNHAANIFLNEENYDVAFDLNKEACLISEKLYEHSPSNYCFEYTDSLFIKALILQQTITDNKKEIKTIYQKMINIFKANYTNATNGNLFNYMVTLYKLANIYSGEEEYHIAALIYEKCLELSDIIYSIANSEETFSQVAVIYLDCGILWYSRDDGNRDLKKALQLFNMALGVYKHLSERNLEYADLYKETYERINVINELSKKFGGNLDGKEINFAVSLLVYSATMKEYTDDGEYFENQEKWLKAHEYYIIALKNLDKLEKLTGTKYRLARADLCERIGTIQVKYNNYEAANAFYIQAYTLASDEAKDTGSKKALLVLSLVLDKMGSIAETSAEKYEFYSFMLEINHNLLEKEESEERLDSLAYTIYKLALCDESHPNKELLNSACKIWKELYEATSNLEYKNRYIKAKDLLRV